MAIFLPRRGVTDSDWHLWMIWPPPLSGLRCYADWLGYRSSQGRVDRATENKEVQMLATQDAQTERAVRTTQCSICQKSVRVNPLKATEVGVICRMCRCRRCSIPMSPKPCHRCGVAHGTPSSAPGLCERCFESAADHCADPADHEGALSAALWSSSDDHSSDENSELLQ